MTEELASILTNVATLSSVVLIPYRYSDDDKTILEIITETKKNTITSTQAIKFIQLIASIPDALNFDGYSNSMTLDKTALFSIDMSKSSEIVKLISKKENHLTHQDIADLKKTIEYGERHRADYITIFISLK